MSTNESRWGMVTIAVVGIAAAAVVAVKILAPNNAGLQSAQGERLDRIERQLGQLLEQNSRMTGVAKQSGKPSAEMASRIENLEALLMDSAQRLDENLNDQMIGSANQRIDELEERLQIAEENRLEKERQQQAVKVRNQKLASAMNDPTLRKKYSGYANDQRNDRHNMIKEKFENEVIDPQWAQERMNLISATFASPALANATLSSTDCRSSMCRVVFSVSKLEGNKSDQFENELMAAFSSTLGDGHTNMKSVSDNNGNTEYNLYMFRDNAAVPKTTNPLNLMSIDQAIEHLNTNY